MPDRSKRETRYKSIRYRPAGQKVSHYGAGRMGEIGSIGYYLSGNPSVWENACLESGERELIFDAPRLSGGGHLLDLGTFKGGSAILMAQGLIHNKLRGHVWTVDNFGPKAKELAEGNMVEAGVNSLITLYHMSTKRAMQKFCARGIQPFTFVFIDASHHYDNVKSDWEYASKMITEDGLIAFHDTNDASTQRVIEEIDRKKWDCILWINRIQVFKKVPNGK
jgi:hypothetical protein